MLVYGVGGGEGGGGVWVCVFVCVRYDIYYIRTD